MMNTKILGLPVGLLVLVLVLLTPGLLLLTKVEALKKDVAQYNTLCAGLTWLIPTPSPKAEATPTGELKKAVGPTGPTTAIRAKVE